MWPNNIPSCIENNSFRDSKKHLQSPTRQTFVSNREDASPSSHTHKNHPRKLKQKVQCMVPTVCS
jgi:hypothetical protein